MAESVGKSGVPGQSVLKFDGGKRTRGGRASTSCDACVKSKKKCVRDAVKENGSCQLCVSRGLECSLKSALQAKPQNAAWNPTLEHEWLTVFLNEDEPFYDLNVLNVTPRSPQFKYLVKSMNYSGSGGVYYGILGEYDPLLRDKFFQYDDNNECWFYDKFFRRIEEHGFSSIFAYKTLKIAEMENYCMVNLTHELDWYLGKASKLYKYVPRLLTLYIKFVLPDVPILDGNCINSIFAATNDVSEEDWEKHYGEFSDPLWVLLVYRVVHRWIHYDTSIPIKNTDVLGGNDLEFVFDKNIFITVAWNQINRELISPTISTLKSMLLFYHIISFKEAGYRTPFEATVLASIVNTAYLLGLHLECVDWNIPKYEKNLRKRLWWTILLCETWNKIAYSVPNLTLNSGTFNQELSMDTCLDMFDDIDDFFPRNTVVSFYMFISLTCTTSKMAKDLFQNDSVLESDIETYENNFHNWYEEYTSLQLDDNVSSCSVALCYVVAMILIFRLRFKLCVDDLEYNKLALF